MTSSFRCVGVFGCLCVILALLPACSSGHYTRLPDEPFDTRGASGVVLGAYGRADDDSFNRLGVLDFVPSVMDGADDDALVHHRATLAVTLEPATNIRGSGRSTLRIDEISPNIDSVNDLARVFRVRIYDLNTAEVLDRLNSDGAMLDWLATGDDVRVVTAVAVLDNEPFERAGVTGGYSVDLRDASGELRDNADAIPVDDVRRMLLPESVVYGYQVSRLGWSLDGGRLVALKPDLPGTEDLPPGAYSRAQIRAERDRVRAEREAEMNAPPPARGTPRRSEPANSDSVEEMTK